MKSLLGLLFALLLLVLVVGTLATIWSLSQDAEFSRKESIAP